MLSRASQEMPGTSGLRGAAGLTMKPAILRRKKYARGKRSLEPPRLFSSSSPVLDPGRSCCRLRHEVDLTEEGSTLRWGAAACLSLSQAETSARPRRRALRSFVFFLWRRKTHQKRNVEGFLSGPIWWEKAGPARACFSSVGSRVSPDG